MDAYKKSLGIKNVFGEEGYSTIERTGYRPSFDVCGLWSGYQGEAQKPYSHQKPTPKYHHASSHIKTTRKSDNSSSITSTK